MGFIETSYGGKPNLSDVNIDSNLNLGTYGITTDGELDINDSDLIGVNQFICKDYLGAIKLEAANNEEWSLILNDTSSGVYSKKFRVPSNVIDGSSIFLKIYATNTDTSNRLINVYQYNPNSGTYAFKISITISANTTTATEFISNNSLTINAGDIFCFHHANNKLAFLGSMGVKIMCNLSSVTGGYWAISD